eukprot:9665013-Alexandrium_andersonii.AAC.1
MSHLPRRLPRRLPPPPTCGSTGRGCAIVPFQDDDESDASTELEEGTPDDWVPPDWAHADFAGENAELGAVALHAMAHADRVYCEAAAFVRDLGLDDHAETYM